MTYSSRIRIGERMIDPLHPTYFIADIAANHDGDLERAKSLIRLAKDAGADCAKFQHFKAADIVSAHGFKTMGAQQSHQSGWQKSVFEIYDAYHTPRTWTDALVRTCQEVGIDFMTTPYDFKAIDSFSPLVPAYKVGSGDITWTAALERIARTGRPVLLATGAAEMAEVERAVEVILEHTPDLVLMQCNTNYTGALENFRSVNLNVLRSFAVHWPGMVLGLSDHTSGHAAVLGAIALGARVIEKHFTDDNSRVGPDHHFAMTPRTWREMVDRSRELELAMGDGVKRIEANETETVVIQRRAVRAAEPLPAGTVLAPKHLTVLRPCPADGLPPYRLDDLTGRTTRIDLPEGAHISWEHLA